MRTHEPVRDRQRSHGKRHSSGGGARGQTAARRRRRRRRGILGVHDFGAEPERSIIMGRIHAAAATWIVPGRHLVEREKNAQWVASTPRLRRGSFATTTWIVRGRTDAATTTWIVRGPHRRRGYDVDRSRAAPRLRRGSFEGRTDAAATTWIVRGPHRGYDADRSRAASTPRLRRGSFEGS